MTESKTFLHVDLASKLQDKVLKQEYLRQTIREKGDYKYLSLVNRNVGPPKALNKQAREQWDARINECSRNCIEELLLPGLDKEIAEDKRTFTKVIQEKLWTWKEEILRGHVLKGFARARNKWKKREVDSDIKLPQSLENLGGVEDEEVRVLLRGELMTTLEQGFSVNTKIGESKDLFKILAHSIYGSGRYRNFIHRNIWKYIHMYNRVEERKFIPHEGRCKNGKKVWMGSWNTFSTKLYNRELCFSSYELGIVSKLYDVNIRVFKYVNNTLCGFVGIWQTRRESKRVVNLQTSAEDTWSLLIGRREHPEEEGQSKVIDRVHSNIGKYEECSVLDNHTDSKSIGSFQHKNRALEITAFKDKVISADKVGIDSDWTAITTESESSLKLIELERKGINSEDDSIFGGSQVQSESQAVKNKITKEKDNKELGWSLITEDSDNIKELEEIEHNIYQMQIDKLPHNRSLSNFSIITDNQSEEEQECWEATKDNRLTENPDYSEKGKYMGRGEKINKVNTVEQWGRYEEDVELVSISKAGADELEKNTIDFKYKPLLAKERDIVEVDRGQEHVGLDCSIISTDSESRKELREIERKVIESLKDNTQDRHRHKYSQYKEDSSSLENREDKTFVDLDWRIKYTDIDSDRELIDRNDKIGTIKIVNSFYRKENKRVEKRRLDKRSKKRKSNISNSSNSSMSSIDDDLKWLFEESSQAREDKNHHVDNKSVDSINSIVSSNSKRGNRKSCSKTKRRDFWRKWKRKIRNSNRNKVSKLDKHLHKEGIQQKNIEAVFDYTSKGLDKSEIELLSKGSTFCIATTKIEEDRFKADIYAYSRRLRLHEEFRDQSCSQILAQLEEEQGEHTDSIEDNWVSQRHIHTTNKEVIVKKRKLPSIYDPDSQNRNLARYCTCIQEESLLALKHKASFKDNISKDHRIALGTLQKKIEDNDIVITLADKGSGIVVVDYDTYINKGTKYIEVEAKAYSETTKTHQQIVLDIVKQRNKIVKKLREHDIIEVDTATYCMKQLEEKITGMKYYYKVHKDTNIDTMPLRPLQSCIGAPTHHLSQVLTDILQPYLRADYIPTFIQDSNQLLYRLSKIHNLVEDNTLISSDVAALYPSIPHKEGLEAVRLFLSQWSEYNNTQLKYIMAALELVITQNFVMWNGKVYSQDSGVAMGTPVAVAYANIFMDWIDTQLRQSTPYIIEHIRYIDDNLFIIPEDKIDDIMIIANSILAPHIRFTYEKLEKGSDRGLPFLDTQLFISSELKIESRLYTKKTDKHTYLLPTSFHPSHITRNIPLAVFNRIRRICSKFDWFQADAMLAIQWLEDRGYNYIDIKRAVEKSSVRDRWEMIEKIEANRDNKKIEDKHKSIYEIPIIVTYNQNAARIKEVLKKRQDLLDASFNQTRVRPRLSFRRQRNINDLLIQKGLRKPILGKVTEECKLEVCGGKPKYRIPCPCKGKHNQQICRCCAHLKLKLDNIKIRLHKVVNCESKNLIYVLGCNICKKLYVGETQQQLKDRFMQHLNNVPKLSQPLYIHFRQVHKAENMYISVLETVRSSDHTFRKVREAWWINRLQTLEPRGFNMKLECSQVYQASSDTITINRKKGISGGPILRG